MNNLCIDQDCAVCRLPNNPNTSVRVFADEYSPWAHLHCLIREGTALGVGATPLAEPDEIQYRIARGDEA